MINNVNHFIDGGGGGGENKSVFHFLPLYVDHKSNWIVNEMK